MGARARRRARGHSESRRRLHPARRLRDPGARTEPTGRRVSHRDRRSTRERCDRPRFHGGHRGLRECPRRFSVRSARRSPRAREHRACVAQCVPGIAARWRPRPPLHALAMERQPRPFIVARRPGQSLVRAHVDRGGRGSPRTGTRDRDRGGAHGMVRGGIRERRGRGSEALPRGSGLGRRAPCGLTVEGEAGGAGSGRR